LKDSALYEDRFLEMLEHHKKLVFKIAHLYSKDAEDRKDLVQEIILQLWKVFPKYNAAYAYSTWIYRIALNVSISFYRKEKSRRNTCEAYRQQFDLLVWHDEAKDDKIEWLYKLIEGLKPLDKAIIILSLEGHTNKQIAQIMGISETNVSTRIYRIKQQLSIQFQPIQSKSNH
jgi:RNA polymerase sigma factor (sigma-70 family)